MSDVVLPDAPFRRRAGLDRLTAALDARGGMVRFVGGVVRDTLLGLDAADVDLATGHAPGEVVRRLAAADIRTVPTGIAHGTVTAVLPSGPVEVTTLRRDVATDGRHAVVAYTDDWREDAARRDFTINALSADPLTGELFDYFGGRDDLAAGDVRFIGDPLLRIAEDHLRILRFFRFHARFGAGAPDASGLAACAARANDLMALSRERIADELLKLLTVAQPSATILLMLEARILAAVLPEIGADAAGRLARLVAAERAAGVPPDPLRRLAALLPRDPRDIEAIGRRLRLSNAARRRLAMSADPALAALPPDAMAYRAGRETAIDRLLLGDTPERVALLAGWERPALPVKGGDLVARGLGAGPIIAATLQAIERRWMAEGFPDAARVATIAAEEMARARDQAPRERQ